MDGLIMENLINIDDLGVPLFLETPIFHCSSRNRKNLPQKSSQRTREKLSHRNFISSTEETPSQVFGEVFWGYS